MMSTWVHRRRWTLGLAVFFVGWYVVQLSVFQLFGEEVARWWFYFESPPDALSPGIFLAPISHDLNTLTHISANVLLLVIAGGLTEPYIGKNRILMSVIGLGYFGTLFANITVIFHHMWIFAGASGGILALWAYSSLQMYPQVAEYIFEGITWSRRSIETVGAVMLLIGTPAFFFHETLWTDQLHSGHSIGILLGYLYYGVETYLNQTENSISSI